MGKKEKKGSVAAGHIDTGNSGGFKLKETLKEEDVEISQQLILMEQHYREVYSYVHTLEEKYQQCKESAFRYADLKSMIKTCITDELMQKAAKYACSESSAADTDMHIEHTGKAAALLRSAQQLHSGVLEASVREEVSSLHKAEIEADIVEKKKKRHKLQIKFLRLHNRLEKLKSDYQQAKSSLPHQRYTAMKNMIKPLIRDKTLKGET